MNGSINRRGPLRFVGKVKSATVSCVGDRWFAGVAAAIERQVPVDLGVSVPARHCNAEKVEGPRVCAGSYSGCEACPDLSGTSKQEQQTGAGRHAALRLARAIADCGFGAFRRQIEYKPAMKGCSLSGADRWFASRKPCSQCGSIADEMPLSVRQWRHGQCGAEHDRDINAARNLETASSALTACGAISADDRRCRT